MFEIRKGINLSHWLSQVFGWSPRNQFVTEHDIRFIQKAGFDHVRLPIDEEEMWYDNGSKNTEAFIDVHNCIKWCIKHDLRVVLDLHILRSHHFNVKNNEGAMTLWGDQNEQDKLIFLWQELSKEFHEYSNEMLAYEFMNEPVAPKHSIWNNLIARGHAAIRELEPERTLVFGPNMWQFPKFFDYFEVPAFDKNILLSFHTYDPLPFTHYKAYWVGFGGYEGPVVYPGTTIPDAHYADWKKANNDTALATNVEAFRMFTKKTFLDVIDPAVRFSQKTGLPLYCSEFGCLPTVPRKDRLAYFNDIVLTFQAYEIAYSSWDYKGDFGIVAWNRETFTNGKDDKELIHILTQ